MHTIIPVSKDDYVSDLMLFKHSMFVRPEWIEPICNRKIKPLYLNVYSDNTLIGKVGGVVRRRPFFNNDVYFYSEPALNNYNSETLNVCLKALTEYAKSNRFARITFNYLDQQSSLIPNEELGLKIKKTEEYVIELDDTYKQFKPGNNFRNKLKKASKAQTEFHRATSKEMVDDLIQFLTVTSKIRISKKRHAYNFFTYKFVDRQMLERFVQSGAGVFYYAVNNGAVNYISLCYELGNRAYELYNGTNSFGYSNGLTGWMVMKRSEYYQSLNFQYFNMGGIPHEKGDRANLAGFKVQSGCIPKRVYIAKSDFLVYPEKVINPFVNLGRLVPYNGFIRFFIRLLG